MTNYNEFPPPYMAGTILAITRHTPQSPASAKLYDYTVEAAQLAHTYQFPEVAASSPPNKSDAQFRELEIVRPIAVGQAKAQVVLCKAALAPGQQPNYIAAKIFDNRCYGQDARDDEALTVFARRARVDYSREAAAYQRIKAHESTRPSLCTLDYFGAWSFQLTKAPLSSSEAAPGQVRGQLHAPRQIRTVNMLLLEYIEGRDLHNILYGTERLILDDEYRLGVWAQFAECEIWLKHIGIRHEDIYEHNARQGPRSSATTCYRCLD